MKKFFLFLMAVAIAAMVSACEQPAENGGVTVNNTVNINFGSDAIDATDDGNTDEGFVPCTTDADCEDGEKCNSQGVCTIPGEDGTNGTDGQGCVVNMDASGCAVVTCGTVSSEPICSGTDGLDGADGKSCTVVSNNDGTSTLSCEDGSSVLVKDGKDGTNGTDGQGCVVNMDASGCAVVTCGQSVSGPICSGKDAPVGAQCEFDSDCDDGLWCSVDWCDQYTGTCHGWMPDFCRIPDSTGCWDDADCDDGDPCTVDSCDPNVGCTNVVRECDDGDISTTDSCDPAIGCVFTRVDAECRWDQAEEVCCAANGPACQVAGWLGQPTPDVDGKPLIERTLAPSECFLPDSGPAASSVCSVTQVAGGSLTGACALKAGGVGITHDGICATTN